MNPMSASIASLKMPKENNIFVLCTLVIVIGIISVSDGDIPRPRGVSRSKASFYQGGTTFQCLDGSETIPFNQVNDDYCDCDDGSDEPGTSACSNGVFQCMNDGHTPRDIVAAWVNDGICDCCDGSDEYDGQTQCDNYCKELGKKAREDAEKRRVIVEEGHKIYLDYVKQGQEAMAEKKDMVADLEANKESLKVEKDSLQALKEEAEIPEKEAKEAHKKAWEVEKERIQSEKDVTDLETAFKDLDRDADNLISVSEMIQHLEFDIDNSGSVSLEEAKEYLEDNEAVDQDTFRDNIWPSIKSIYKPLSQQAKQQTTDTPPMPTEIPAPPTDDHTMSPPIDDDDELDERYYGDEDDEDDYDMQAESYDEEDYDDIDEMEKMEAERVSAERERDGKDNSMPDYDEETQQLISAADEARKTYDDVEQKYSSAERELNDVNKFLSLDLGPSNEYYPLKGQCYEITDSQYTYKLCPFDRVTQKPKHGGSETSLGVWGHWAGPEEDKYSAMKFERGQNCWQGPDRSTKVTVSCDQEMRVHSPSEPSRCEYELHFTTPAACVPAVLQKIKDPNHDEL